MLYPENIEQKIDFLSIRQMLRKHCSFEIGREVVDEMTFLTDADAIGVLLRRAQEMINILSDASIAYPHCEMHDLRESLSRIRIDGLFLDEEELSRLRKALDAVIQYMDFFHSLPAERFPLLHDWESAAQQGGAPTSSSGAQQGEAPTSSSAAQQGAASTSTSAAQQGAAPVPFREILRDIDRILDKYGQLRDNASPELARIRRELVLSQGSVNRALQQILRQAQQAGIIDKDVTPTLREGRLVLPVPPAYKRKIGGIVHDESATGKTVYVEPQQVVEANNRIRELEGDERRERTRILQAFAATLRPHAPGIRHSQYYLAEIDFLHAKALLAREMKALSPELLPYPYVELREARHPLLYLNFLKQNKEVVPLTLKLGTEAPINSSIHQSAEGRQSIDQNSMRILVISGPNAGGKSVCLKTVALLQYMLQCGLPVPVREDTKMGIFRDILIDIGDEQSIEDDLSTYSSHLRNMKQFVRTASDRSLFLIDEFGGGTEPLLGGAIAEAILERLCASGAFGVITTHYTNLKHFADSHEGVLNGAMLYDRGALRPLFQLSVGQPGSSFALEIARQIGLPDDIIASAKQLVGEDNIQYDRSLQDIARDKRYWAEKRKQIHEKEKRLQELTERYEAEMAEIKQKRKDVLQKAKEEAADLLQKSNRTIEKTIRVIQETKADKEATKRARERVQNLKESLQENAAPQPVFPEKAKGKKPAAGAKNPLPAQGKGEPQGGAEAPELAVGCCVRIKGQQTVGEIVSMTGKQATVAFGNLKSQVPLKRLEYVSKSQAKKAATHSALQGAGSNIYASVADSVRKRKLSFRDELDLRGFRADDALQEVMNYIDDAIMVGATEVRILHGTGTGALKQLVRDYLRMQHRVQSFHDGDPDRGGAGITVVEF